MIRKIKTSYQLIKAISKAKKKDKLLNLLLMISTEKRSNDSATSGIELTPDEAMMIVSICANKGIYSSMYLADKAIAEAASGWGTLGEITEDVLYVREILSDGPAPLNLFAIVRNRIEERIKREQGIGNYLIVGILTSLSQRCYLPRAVNEIAIKEKGNLWK